MDNRRARIAAVVATIVVAAAVVGVATLVLFATIAVTFAAPLAYLEDSGLMAVP
jgi:Fe2+ transport system protein B